MKTFMPQAAGSTKLPPASSGSGHNAVRQRPESAPKSQLQRLKNICVQRAAITILIAIVLGITSQSMAQENYTRDAVLQYRERLGSKMHIGPVEIHNDGDEQVQVRLIHPDAPDRGVFARYNFAPGQKAKLTLDGKDVNYGSDWGIQIVKRNGDASPIRFLGEVSTRSGNQHVASTNNILAGGVGGPGTQENGGGAVKAPGVGKTTKNTIASEVTTKETGFDGRRYTAESDWTTITVPANCVIIKDKTREHRLSANGSEYYTTIEYGDEIEVVPGTGITQPRTIRVKTFARSPSGSGGKGRGWLKVQVEFMYTQFKD